MDALNKRNHNLPSYLTPWNIEDFKLLSYLKIHKKENDNTIHQGRWNTITTWILLYYSTHLNAEPLGVATP